MHHSPLISLLLQILGIFNEQLILVNFQGVSLLSEVKALLLALTKAPFQIVNVSSELALLLSIFGSILNSQLKGVVI